MNTSRVGSIRLDTSSTASRRRSTVDPARRRSASFLKLSPSRRRTPTSHGSSTLTPRSSRSGRQRSQRQIRLGRDPRVSHSRSGTATLLAMPPIFPARRSRSVAALRPVHPLVHAHPELGRRLTPLTARLRSTPPPAHEGRSNRVVSSMLHLLPASMYKSEQRRLVNPLLDSLKTDHALVARPAVGREIFIILALLALMLVGIGRAVLLAGDIRPFR